MIIIPAAGQGRRFREAGYGLPKHLLPLAGKDMIERVVDTVRPLDPHGGVFVATQEVVGKTKGAVDTILRAWARLNYTPVGQPRLNLENDVLVVANCDQLVMLPEDVGNWGNGIVFTFKSASSAHSYVTTDRGGRITGIVEKPETPPSDKAVSGVYAFPRAEPFIEACKAVQAAPSMSAGEMQGEQYVSFALARMIAAGYGLYAVDVPTAILGTPEDFQRFETALQFAEVLS